MGTENAAPSAAVSWAESLFCSAICAAAMGDAHDPILRGMAVLPILANCLTCCVMLLGGARNPLRPSFCAAFNCWV